MVGDFREAQGLEGLVRYLIAERAQLEGVWDAWQVATRVPRDDPELIEHTALIYGVSAAGELATAYPVGLAPEAIVRDRESPGGHLTRLPRVGLCASARA